jgi:hypothetical protein
MLQIKSHEDLKAFLTECECGSDHSTTHAVPRHDLWRTVQLFKTCEGCGKISSAIVDKTDWSEYQNKTAIERACAQYNATLHVR